MSVSPQRRIACVQFDSKHADVPRNISTVLSLVDTLVAHRESIPIDLLVLPELALTGYVFENEQDIIPFLEDARTFWAPSRIPDSPTTSRDNAPSSSTSPSPTILMTECIKSCASSSQPSLTLAAHLAQQLHCHVVVGFPERGPPREAASSASADKTIAPPFDARPPEARKDKPSQLSVDCAFNSAALIAPDGALQHVFRKHFLFETDEKWAAEGAGFEVIQLPTLGTVCVAICMDLNPFQFRTPFETCELASFCVERDVDLLVMPMAWLLPKHEQQKPAHDNTSGSQPTSSLSTINYWAMRCMPFFNRDNPPTTGTNSTASSSGPVTDVSPHGKLRYLVATNRSGTEAMSTFAGSSCVLQMKRGQRPLLLDSLGTTQEACLVVALTL